jgi:hypothetical protein
LKRPLSSKWQCKQALPKKIAHIIEVLTKTTSCEIDISTCVNKHKNVNTKILNLVDLYIKASQAQCETKECNKIEIRNWYYYAESFENRVGELTAEGMADKVARTAVYKEILSQLSHDKMRQVTKDKKGSWKKKAKNNLRQRTCRARKLYYLFSEIGVEKINRAGEFSANELSSFNDDNLNLIIDNVKGCNN